MKIYSNNILKILIIIILILQVLLVIFNIFILKQIYKQKDINEVIEFNAETMAQIDKLRYNQKPVIIVFGSDYCDTCKNYMPYIKEIHNKYNDKVIIKYIDTAKHASIRKDYNIELIPSTIIYESNGEAYKPSYNINLYENKEKIEEEKYKSDTIIEVSGENLGLNNSFKYGQNEKGEIVYTKYIGLITEVQLEEIIEDLLVQRN